MAEKRNKNLMRKMLVQNAHCLAAESDDEREEEGAACYRVLATALEQLPANDLHLRRLWARVKPMYESDEEYATEFYQDAIRVADTLIDESWRDVPLAEIRLAQIHAYLDEIVRALPSEEEVSKKLRDGLSSVPILLFEKIADACIEGLGMRLPLEAQLHWSTRKDVTGLIFAFSVESCGDDEDDSWQLSYFPQGALDASGKHCNAPLPCNLNVEDSKGVATDWWVGLDGQTGDIVAHCTPSPEQPHRCFTLCARETIAQLGKDVAFDPWVRA